MNLLQLIDKLQTLREDNHIPDDTEFSVERVDRNQYEGAIVGVETRGRYGKIVVVIQVQEYY